MGAASSIGIVGNQSGKKLANEILNEILGNTDMSTYVNLTDPKACAAFTIHTQQNILAKMKERNMYPAQGGIAIIPQAKPIGPTSSREDIEREKERIAICFNFAHVISKIVQTYAALAMNLFKATPSRRDLTGGRRTKRKAKLQGGARPRAGSTLETKLKKSPLYGLTFFDVVDITTTDRGDMTLTISLSALGEKRIETHISSVYINQDNINVNARYIPGRKQEPIECTIGLKREKEEGNYTMTTLLINDIPVLYIGKSGGNIWSYSYLEDSAQFKPVPARGQVDGRELNKKIREALGGEVSLTRGEGNTESVASGNSSSSPPAPSGSTSTAPSPSFQAPTVSSGEFFPKNVKNIKDLFTAIQQRKKPLPQPLAFARAHILMNPIDPADHIASIPFTTQLCMKDYDFEGTEYIPKKGMSLKATPYFKSWMNLYYDSFRRNPVTLKYEWTMGADGEKLLKQASNDLAILYTNRDDERFLIDSKLLPGFDTICKYVNRTFIIDRDERLFEKMREAVQGLLFLQAEYTTEANKILAELFDFSEKGKVSFKPDMLGDGGLVKLQYLIRYTRAVLLNYYMKVESFYIKGVIDLEEAKKKGLLIEY